VVRNCSMVSEYELDQDPGVGVHIQGEIEKEQ
jgi:hypothetical protein